MRPTVRQGVRAAALAAPVIGVALLIAAGLAGARLPALSQQSPPAVSKTEPTAQGPLAAQQKRPGPPPQIRYGAEDLPRPVLDLREAMQGAIEAGQIEELRNAYDLSEIKPDLGAKTEMQKDAKSDDKVDPVAHWKSISGDGQGRDVLAALSLLLDGGYAVIRGGADIENNKLYVWPYFAEIPLDRLTPRQEVELLRLVPASVARDMQAKGRYTYWRLVIGADGTWHALRKGE